MRFKGLDLNLLVALDIMLTERNVSRAADKLCLSQSATSGALARLREYFGDDLLVQVGRQMVLTARAQTLAPKVRAALMQIEGTIIRPPEFDPGTVNRTVHIVASDYVVITVLAKAIRAINMKAPNLTIVVDQPTKDPDQLLARGDVDLIAMPEVYMAPDHPSEPYFDDEYVVIACANHPTIGDTITREQFFDLRHVLMRFGSHTLTFESFFLKHTGSERKIATVAGSFAAVPHLLRGTNNIAVMQGKLAKIFAQTQPLKVLDLPVEIPPLKEFIQWHRFSEGDECLAWIRKEIIDAL